MACWRPGISAILEEDEKLPLPGGCPVKPVFLSPRRALPDPASFPDLTTHEARWHHMSALAGSHRQEDSVMDLTGRSIDSPSSLKYGVPPKVAQKVTELKCPLAVSSSSNLPQWLDVIASLFPSLRHLHLGPCRNHEDKRMRRLYVLYRLPDLETLDGVKVLEDEQELARPSSPSGRRVRKEEWVKSVLDEEEDEESVASHAEHIEVGLSGLTKRVSLVALTGQASQLDIDVPQKLLHEHEKTEQNSQAETQSKHAASVFSSLPENGRDVDLDVVTARHSELLAMVRGKQKTASEEINTPSSSDTCVEAISDQVSDVVTSDSVFLDFSRSIADSLHKRATKKQEPDLNIVSDEKTKDEFSEGKSDTSTAEASLDSSERTDDKEGNIAVENSTQQTTSAGEAQNQPVSELRPTVDQEQLPKLALVQDRPRTPPPPQNHHRNRSKSFASPSSKSMSSPVSRSLSSPFPLQFRGKTASPITPPAQGSCTKTTGRSSSSSSGNNNTENTDPRLFESSQNGLGMPSLNSPRQDKRTSLKPAARGSRPPPCPASRRVVVPTQKEIAKKKSPRRWKQRGPIMSIVDDYEEEEEGEEEDDDENLEERDGKADTVPISG